MDVAHRCAGQCEAISGWMPRIFQVERLSSAGVDRFGASAAISTKLEAFTDHLAPLRSKMIGADSTPRNFKIRPDNAEIGPPALPLAIAIMAFRCSGLARSSTIRPTGQFPFPISVGVKPTTMNPKPNKQYVAVNSPIDLKSHRQCAGALGRCNRQLCGHAGTDKIATAGLIVRPAITSRIRLKKSPRWC